MNPAKKTLFTLAAFFIFFVFLVGGWEIYIRLFKAKIMNEMTYYDYRQEDPLVNHSLKPNSRGVLGSREYRVHYKINSFGCRDNEYPLKHPENTHRILVVGDSFAEGYGMDIKDTFIKITERDWNKNHPGKRIEIINCGVMSYSPILEYIWLRERGLKLDPDMVALFLDQSDLQDDYIYSKSTTFVNDIPQTVNATGLYTTQGRNYFNRFDKFLFHHSAFYVYLRHQWINIYEKHVEHKDEKEGPLGKNIVFGDIETDRLFFLRGNAQDFDAHWQRTSGYLKLISDMLKEKNTAFMLVVYPYAIQIDGNEWPARGTWGFEEGKIYPPSPYFEKAEEFSQSVGAYYLNLFDALYSYKKGHPGEKLYFDLDGHWTKPTHKLIAEEFTRYLSSINDFNN